MKEIPLTQGFVTLVDNEDYGRLMQYKWHVMKNFNMYYATREVHVNGVRTSLQMHRNILNLSLGDGKLVDHKDRNGLNNQKENLRITTASLNMHNRKINCNNTSGYRGVHSMKSHGNQYWNAAIKGQPNRENCGCFKDPIMAAKAYDRAAIRHFGDAALLNFPESRKET